MFTMTYMNSDPDKPSYGDGPWQEEPDKVQWVDPETGLACLVVRGPSGALCGYVAVEFGHPWFGVDYTGDPDVVEVHGGLTFSDFCMEEGDQSQRVCHMPEPGKPDRVWWLGFDCGHSWDVRPRTQALERNLARLVLEGYGPGETYREIDFVKGEVTRLAEQLAAVA